MYQEQGIQNLSRMDYLLPVPQVARSAEYFISNFCDKQLRMKKVP